MSDNAFIQNYSASIEQLVKELRNKPFRFIPIETNAPIPVRRQVKRSIQKHYPNHSTTTVTAKNETALSLIQAVYRLGTGIAFIDDFDTIIDQPQKAEKIEQSIEKLCTFHIAVIAFVPYEYKTKYKETVPKLFAKSNLVLELKYIYSYNLIKPEIAERVTGSFLEQHEIEKRKYFIGKLTDELDNVTDNKNDITFRSYILLHLLQFNADLHQYAEALKYGNQLLHLTYNFKKHNKKELAKLNKLIGTLYYENHQYEEAEIHLNKALQYAEETHFGEEIPLILHELGTAFRREGNFNSAIKVINEAIRFSEKNFGKYYTQIATYQSNLASVYLEIKETKPAIELLEKALINTEINLIKEHPRVAVRQSNLALVYQEAGEYNKARILLEKALNIARKNAAQNKLTIAIHQSNLAQAYRGLGNYKRARILLEDAVQKTGGKNHPALAYVYHNLAWVYRDTKKRTKARDMYHKAYLVLLETLGKEHPNTISVKKDLEFITEQLQKRHRIVQTLDELSDSVIKGIQLIANKRFWNSRTAP